MQHCENVGCGYSPLMLLSALWNSSVNACKLHYLLTVKPATAVLYLPKTDENVGQHEDIHTFFSTFVFLLLFSQTRNHLKLINMWVSK